MKVYKGKISVIMPAYNEAPHIYGNIRETCAVFDKTGRAFEVIVVDDGSKDDTYKEALRAVKELRCVRAVHCPVNGGKGSALKEGFERATGDYIVFLDADLDLHPSQLHRFFRVMRESRADVVIGSKYHKESRLNYPAWRKIVSRVYALMLRLLFNLPLRDTQTGLKVFSAAVLRRIFPMVLCKRYAYDLELLAAARRLGYKIAEAPVVLEFRRRKERGRIGLKDMLRTGFDTMAIFHRMYIKRYYDGI